VRFKTSERVSVGRLFEYLEDKKSELYILQYSIRQATVEQIFNKFAEEEGVKMD
jgi:ATP-binding cassette subfamily A (ABC1) protein 3